MSDENCIHGINKTWCDLCSTSDIVLASKPRTRKRKVEATVARTVEHQIRGLGMVIIRQTTKGESTFVELGPKVKFLHVSRYLLLKELKRILDECPNLQTIQVSKSTFSRISSSHFELCKTAGVDLRQGYISPAQAEAWLHGDPRSPAYRDQYKFAHNMSNDQRDMLNELLKLGFEEAQMFVRYYCLNGGERINLNNLSKQFGFSEKSKADHVVSCKLRAVLKYLDPNFETGEDALSYLSRLKRNIKKTRQIIAAKDWEEKFCKDLQIEKIPEGYPPSRFDILKSIRSAQLSNDKKVTRFKRLRSRDYQIMLLRFGLSDGVYHILQEIGDQYELSRERIRQIEQDFLNTLGYED